MEVNVIKKSFTLIELMIVIAIIAILAGLTLQGVGVGIDGAKRIESNSNLRQIGLAVLGKQNGKRSSYGKDFLPAGGIRTLTSTENGDFAVDGNIISATTSAYQIFKKYKGLHPFDPENGYYIFMGNTVSGNAKKKFDADTRLAMEFYNWETEGDGKVGIVFGDNRVEEISISTSPSALNILEFLSIKGLPEDNE
jgi:prepilin-type N-terminal cleavage/methylation domain-containing protein